MIIFTLLCEYLKTIYFFEKFYQKSVMISLRRILPTESNGTQIWTSIIKLLENQTPIKLRNEL